VNEQLRLLVELQKLDSRIIAKDRQIKAIPSRVSAAERPLRQAQARLEERRMRYDAADKGKRDKEMELDDLNERINKLRARTNEIKDNKAYQALLKEIESAEKHRYSVEDEILSLMENIEAEVAEVRDAENALAAEKRREAELRKELDAEVGEARKELDDLKQQRGSLSGGLDEDNYGLYMTLLKDLGGVAVTEAREEVCQGCNMNIMPQLFVEIKKNEQIIQCPQCRRILYYSDRHPEH
jgi:predicted  nucleic acid-binding Zn-ribbon protein